MPADAQCYSIVPAAGSSRRMGKHKLLLPWPSAEYPKDLVIHTVLRAWCQSKVDQVVVVVREDDSVLRGACEGWDVCLELACGSTADMKASCQLGIQRLQHQYAPTERSRCFVAPADLPGLSSELIDAVLNPQFEDDGDFVVSPRFEGESGHPALMPWSLMQRVMQLPQSQGIDSLVKQSRRHYIDLPKRFQVADIDTQEDYQTALSQATLDRTKGDEISRE